MHINWKYQQNIANVSGCRVRDDRWLEICEPHPFPILPAVVEFFANESLDAVKGVVWVAPCLPDTPQSALTSGIRITAKKGRYC